MMEMKRVDCRTAGIKFFIILRLLRKIRRFWVGRWFSLARVCLWKVLFDHLEAGDSIEDFLEGFPSVRREQVISLLEESREHALAVH